MQDTRGLEHCHQGDGMPGHRNADGRMCETPDSLERPVHYRLVTEFADGTRAADPRHFATADAAQAEMPLASETAADAVVVTGKRMMSGSWWHSLTGAQWYASPEAAAAAETVSEAAGRHDDGRGLQWATEPA